MHLDDRDAANTAPSMVAVEHSNARCEAAARADLSSRLFAAGQHRRVSDSRD
jgi:hypothetical protein